MNIEKRIRLAGGEDPVELLLKNARIINVFTGEIEDGHIAVSEGIIVGTQDCDAKQIVDLQHRFVAPGFIDAHVHIESSMAGVMEFAKAVAPRGVTTVIADPHEIANVMGADGIRYMIDSAENQPINIFFMLPSCVPATDMETAGASLSANDLEPFFNERRVLGLAEVMNFPGVIYQSPEVMAKLELAHRFNKKIDGHAPGLSGKSLQAYIAAGIASDHECTTPEEALEKLRSGMVIMVREGTGAKNLEALYPIITPQNSQRMMWCTDDRHPHDLLAEGHLDFIVSKAIGLGLDPVIAIQMATINPARYFGLNHLGAIAVGRRADIIVFSDLSSPKPFRVYAGGKLVAEDGVFYSDDRPSSIIHPPMSIHVNIDQLDFSIPADGERIRVIEILPDQIVTRQHIAEVAVTEDKIESSPYEDLLKIAVVERHHGTGNIGKGFVKGFGLKSGALASTVAHDSHNIVVVGVDDADMKTAVKALVDIGGGLVVVDKNEVIASLPLPIAGLMSDLPIEAVQHRMDGLLEASRRLGSDLNDPFMTLSFLALPVIPDLKITDKGLVDVNQFKIVPLFVKIDE